MPSREQQAPVGQKTSRPMTFDKELEALINKHSQENASNTPDFILAQYLVSCLAAWNVGVQQRETWHGRDERLTAPDPESGGGVAMPSKQDMKRAPAKIAADLIELAVEYGADDQDLQPIVEKAIAKLVADTREAAIRKCADYVRQCGTASHPNGYGDWCGGEIDPIKLLTGIADVLDRRASSEKWECDKCRCRPDTWREVFRKTIDGILTAQCTHECPECEKPLARRSGDARLVAAVRAVLGRTEDIWCGVLDELASALAACDAANPSTGHAG